jgi:hypothetical protein
LNRLGEHLIQNFRGYLEECYLDRAEDLVLITGVGRANNWEADTVVMDARSFSVGGSAALPTMVGLSGELGFSRAHFRSPGFNTGHIDHEDTETPGRDSEDTGSGEEDAHALLHAPLQNIDSRRDGPGSDTELALRFPSHPPFQSCCVRGTRCQNFKKQYVFVQTARIRSKAFLGVSVEVSASGLVYTRWRPSRKTTSSSTLVHGKLDTGNLGATDQETLPVEEVPVLDKLEGDEGIGDCVSWHRHIHTKTENRWLPLQDILYDSVAELKLKVRFGVLSLRQLTSNLAR